MKFVGLRKQTNLIMQLWWIWMPESFLSRHAKWWYSYGCQSVKWLVQNLYWLMFQSYSSLSIYWMEWTVGHGMLIALNWIIVLITWTCSYHYLSISGIDPQCAQRHYRARQLWLDLVNLCFIVTILKLYEEFVCFLSLTIKETSAIFLKSEFWNENFECRIINNCKQSWMSVQYLLSFSYQEWLKDEDLCAWSPKLIFVTFCVVWVRFVSEVSFFFFLI